MTRDAVPSFGELLAPLDEETFLADHLGRHALRLPARPLPAFDDLDTSALSAAGPSHVDVIRGGIATSVAQNTVPDGCSLRVRRVQTVDATVERFARTLATSLREEVNVNLYLSPSAETPGLAPHADPYDLFVLQLRGTKRWELLGDPDHRLPDQGLTHRDGFTMGTHGELELQAGEVLYLPRGLLHRAHNAGPDPSIHLTASILVKTVGSCIAWLAAELERRLDTRRPLPLRASREDYDDAIAAMHSATEAILADPDRADAFLAHRDVVEYEAIGLSPEDERNEPRR